MCRFVSCDGRCDTRPREAIRRATSIGHTLLAINPGERWLLIVAGLALVYPNAIFDYFGIALIMVVIVMQKLRKA